MKIYLVRHTEAIPKEASADEDRWLTPAGRKAARKAGKRLRELDVRWGAVLTSPLVRSVQTAELVAARVKGKAQVTVIEALRPGGGSWAAFRRAAEATGAETIAMVGHEPDLGAAAGQALGLPALDLPKGAVVGLEVDPAGKVSPIGILEPGSDGWSEIAARPPASRPARARGRRPAG